MKFTWIGGPSFVLELGPFRVVGDPVLRTSFDLEGTRVERATPLPAAELAGADLVLVTSTRADHLDADAVARCTAGTVIVPAGTSFAGATALAHGGSVRLEKQHAVLAIAAVPAAGQDSGYFLRFEHGERPFTVYVTGDTVFSEATREIQRVHGYANLLVLHAGAERAPDGALRSADSKEAMQIVYRMQPNAIALVHHSSFSHYIEPVTPLVEKISPTIYETRLRVPGEGESFEKKLGPGAE